MSLENLEFTPAEFARIAQIDKAFVPDLEKAGWIETHRKRIGRSDRKMIAFDQLNKYFNRLRKMADQNKTSTETTGDGATAAGPQIPIELLKSEIGAGSAAVAVATGFIPPEPLHKVQMFYNVKGGTGKSTLASQFCMRAAVLGYRVLALDLDGQGHLSVNLDILDGHERPTVYDVLINDLPLSDALIPVTKNLDLLPANLGLCNIDLPLNQKPRREYRLAEAIAKIYDDYDLIVADANPTTSILNCSMMVASQQVNVICATNPLSFHGMSLVMSTIDELKREFKLDTATKIIANMYDSREVISQEVLGELEDQFPEIVAQTVVNRSADLNEATKRRSSVWEVNHKGNGSEDIARLTEELIRG